MTKKCCIPNCERWNCDPKNFYLSYFRIPLDLERRQKWLDKINAQFNTNIEPKACSNYVCSLHFVRESLQFGPTGKLLRVKKDALPSVFVDSKEYIVPRKAKLIEQCQQNENMSSLDMDTSKIKNQESSSEDEAFKNSSFSTIFLEDICSEKMSCEDISTRNIFTTNPCDAQSSSLKLHGGITIDDSNDVVEEKFSTSNSFVEYSSNSETEQQNKTNIFTINPCDAQSSSSELHDEIYIDDSIDVVEEKFSTCNSFVELSSNFEAEQPQRTFFSSFSDNSIEFVCGKEDRNILKKSLESIDMTKVDFRNIDLVKRLFCKAQKDIVNLKKKLKNLEHKHNRLKSSVKILSPSLPHFKSKNLISKERSDPLQVS